MTYGYYSREKKHGEPGKMLDWAWVEATEILPDGSIVPGASVGATPEILASAEKIIVEVNTGLPSMKGLHDIVISQDPCVSLAHFLPFFPLARFSTLPECPRAWRGGKADLALCNSPHRLPYLVTHPADRIGTLSIPVDPERVVAIVETNKPDNTGKNAPETEDSKKIAGHLINFFEEEVAAGRMPKNLLPLQSGIGNVANSIIGGLKESKFERMQVWTGAFVCIRFIASADALLFAEVLQDTFLPLLKSGKLDFATAT